MSKFKNVIVRMEESYMTAMVEYTDLEYKLELCNIIGKIEKKMKVHPEVIYQIDSEERGSCSIEFSGDNYTCSRSCGDFIEELISRLKIEESVLS